MATECILRDKQSENYTLFMTSPTFLHLQYKKKLVSVRAGEGDEVRWQKKKKKKIRNYIFQSRART